MEQQPSNAAKYAFYYLLSLVSLIFAALSTGMIIFQIINKKIFDALSLNQGYYSAEVMKFAISAIIITTPIYFVTMWFINKNLYDGKLGKDSGVRKWLTYLVLFISSVVVIGWLIGTIQSYLGGELTTKFILKALTALLISATVFSYYFYDIRREQVVGAKDKIIKIYFFGSLAVILAVLVCGFIYSDSPQVTRNKNQDMALLNSFDTIDNSINSYYTQTKKLPANLDELVNKTGFLTGKDIIDQVTNKKIEYKVKGASKYEICGDFKTANKGQIDQNFEWLNSRWPHDAGHQCFTREVVSNVDSKIPASQPVTVPPAVKK